MKSRPWGRKTPPASTHRPHSLPHPPRPRLHFRAHVCTSLPAFTLPPHSLPRPPQSNRPPAAAVIHNGLSTEKLSTLLPAALCKTCSPSRLRTRIYNISFARSPLPGSVRVAPEKSPRRCATVSRAAVRRVGEGEGKGRRPLAQCRTMPLVCRITVRKGGSAPGQPRPCPCILPAAACLRPRSCPLMGEVPSAMGEGEGKGGRPLAQQPALACLPPRPRRLNGSPASAGGGGKTTEWRTAAPQRPHTERREETILAQFAYQDAKAHKALCTICDFRLHALQAFAQLFHSLAQIAPQRPEKSTNRRPKV